jgi:hypothetical protein
MNIMTETQLEFNFMKLEQLVLNFDNSSYFSTGTTLTLKVDPTCTVVFSKTEYEDNKLDYTNTEVGRLDWSDGKMKFEGEADESAQLFFDNIIKIYIQTQLPLSGWKS